MENLKKPCNEKVVIDEIKDDSSIISSGHCPKCDNPLIMYWCNECEENNEDGVCLFCGKDTINIDKEYHNNCN